MNKKDDALKLALHHIENGAHNRRYIRHVIREALAQSQNDEEQPAQQEPKKDLMWSTVAMQERHDQRIQKVVATLGRIKQEQLAEQPAQSQFDHTAAANAALRDAQNKSYQIARAAQQQEPAGYFRLREYGSALIHDQVSEDAKHNEGVFPLYASPQPSISAGPITPAMMQGPTPEQKAQMVAAMSKLVEAAHGSMSVPDGKGDA